MTGKAFTASELASLSEFSAEDQEFLQDVLNNITTVFVSTRSRRIQKLVEQTQQQAEELCLLNEKLAARTRELQTIQEKLEAADQALAEKAQLLEVQKKELALASKYKSEFLANMSHELRTPMNSLLPLAQSLQENREGNLTENQQHSAGIIFDSGRELLDIIDEILDLAFLEAGRVKKETEEMVLADVAENMHNLFIHMAAAKGLAFQVSVDPALPSTMLTDRTRLEQILKKIISNSLKFTEQGEISLAFARPPADVQFRSDTLVPAETLAVRVADTGIGIPAKKQEAIFEAFQQADGSTARKYGGNGLGLSISRQLAALLGGEIHLSSEPEKGSVFILYLPFQFEKCIGEDQQTEKKQPENDRTGGSEPAEQADLDEAKAFSHDERLSRDKERERNRYSEFIILKNARSGERLPDETIMFLHQEPVQETDAPDTLSESSKEDAVLNNKQVLLVDNDMRNVFALSAALRAKGMEVSIAEHGRMALDMLVQDPEVDIILMDMMMPEMDGYTTIGEIRENKTISSLPVIALTAKDMKGDQEKCLKAGADTCFAKPVDMEQLFAMMRQLLYD
ncbi:MAG: ATP-binding protein [Candidatus Electrothrix sp. YB6]